MGQYFKLVNVTKREYINPYCCGDLAKFAEAITGNMGSLLMYLVRKSTGGGGGDIPIAEEMYGIVKEMRAKLKQAKEENNEKDIEWYTRYLERYSKELKYAKKIKLAGHWTGDQIALVGDYDRWGMYRKAAAEFKNITHLVIEEYNEFIGEDYGIYPDEGHTCYDYQRKQWIKQEFVDDIENTKTMIKEHRCTPPESGYEHIKYLEESLEIFEAEDEYYGPYKEPKWYFQVPNRKIEHKGKLAPDMVLSAGGGK